MVFIIISYFIGFIMIPGTFLQDKGITGRNCFIFRSKTHLLCFLLKMESGFQRIHSEFCELMPATQRT